MTVVQRRNDNDPRNDRQAKRGTNPFNKNGKRAKCAVCQTTFHWANDYPHKEEVKMTETSEEEHCNLKFY